MDGTQAIRAGDLDNNGKIDIFDLLGILKVLGGSQAASGGADVDGNGKVDIFDLLAILRLLAG
jgi:Ca2+-binding EF-hand superfamily protein